MSPDKIIKLLLFILPLSLLANNEGHRTQLENGRLKIVSSKAVSSNMVSFSLPANISLIGGLEIKVDGRKYSGFPEDLLSVSEMRMGGYQLRAYTLELDTEFRSFEIDGAYARTSSFQRILAGFVPLVESITGMPLDDDVEVIEGKYIIIMPNVESYRSLVEALAGWKRQLGYQTVIKQLSEIGSSAEDIRNFLQDAYQTWDIPPEYVLLIGDVDGATPMPSNYFSAENDVSDHPYACIAGDDYLPDLFIGRLSVDSFTHLAIAIQKIIGYEKTPFTDNQTWFRHAVSIGGNYNNIGDYPITPVWVAKWVRHYLLEQGYAEVDTLFYPPNVNAADEITGFINEGASLVNYRGWADANGWHFPEYHVENLEDLQNGWMLPFVTSIVCNTGDFANTVDPCFGEAWLRAGTIQVPKGAIAFYGPSDLHTSTKFNNAICTGMYQGMFEENLKRTGPAGVRGKIELFNGFPQNREHGDWVEFYFHVYNLLGDPSIRIWTKEPETMNVSFPPNLVVGQTSCTVSAAREGLPLTDALVTMTSENEILAKEFTDLNGVCHLVFSPLNENVTITISKDGFIPCMQEYVPLSPTTVMAKNFNIHGLTNGVARKGDQVSVDFDLINRSSVAIDSFVVHLRSESNNVVMGSDDILIPIFSPGDSLHISGILLDVVDLQPFLRYEKVLVNSGECGAFQLPVQSIYLNRGRILLNGQGTSVATADGSTNLQIELVNSGNYPTGLLSAELNSVNEQVSISVSQVNYASIDSNSAALNPSPFVVDFSALGRGSQVPFELVVTDTYDVVQNFPFTISVGPLTSDIATGPDNWGYFIYDNFDQYDGAPLNCEWKEISSLANQQDILLGDDDIEVIQLPFQFRFYGDNYSTLYLCSNGWISFKQVSLPWFRNWSMSAAITPEKTIAGFWDDLKPPVGASQMTVRMGWNDELIVFEWVDALNRYDYDSANPFPERFQIQLWKQGIIASDKDDGVIDIVFQEVNDVDLLNNFATVGIKGGKNEGFLDYIYARIPSAGATSLDSIQFFRISSLTPEGVVVSAETSEPVSIFNISTPYPNPFNSRLRLHYSITGNSSMKWEVFDISGRLVDSGRINSTQNRGEWSWDTANIRDVELPSGVYLIKFSDGGNNSVVRKALLLK